MFRWLISNKEWLFSGIGVTVVTTVVAWVLSRRRKTGMVVAAAPDKIATLLPEEVCAAAEDRALTTLQRSLRHDKYSGQRVRWTGRVSDVVGEKSSDELTLWFHPSARDGSDAGYVYARLDRKVADALLVIKKRDTVTIEGTIRMPGTFGSVSLQEPVLLDHIDASNELTKRSSDAALAKDLPVDPSIRVMDVLSVLHDHSRTVLNVKEDAQRFVGKRVHWKGLLDGVFETRKGSYEMSFRPTVKGGQDCYISAEVSDADASLMHAMSPGDVVEVLGTISLWGRSCHLERAAVVGHYKASSNAPLSDAPADE